MSHPKKNVAAMTTVLYSPSGSSSTAPHAITVSSKLGKYFAAIMILAVDYIAVVLALVASAYLRSHIIPSIFTGMEQFSVKSNYIYCVIPLIYITFLAYEGMYSKRLPFWQGAEYLFKTSTYAAGLVVIITYFSGDATKVSRIFVFASWIFSFISLTTCRYFTKQALTLSGLWLKPVVIVGAGKTTELLAKSFANDPFIGYKIVGLVEDEYHERSLIQQFPLIGTFSHAEQAILNSGVDDIIIATPGLEREILLDLIYRLQPYGKKLIVVPDLFGIPLSNVQAQPLFDERILMLSVRNNLAIVYNRIFKRIFDFVFSAFGILLISPLLLVIAATIYLDSPGPVIFSQKRIGAKGNLFTCYKFRSMIPNAQEILDNYLKQNTKAREEWEQDFKLRDDPRITTVGKFLRKTSLDELPQLINVIKGEMSLVGPRPIIGKEIQRYSVYINNYYMVKPGITGFWQVNGRNDVDYDSRVQMDSWYVRNWSMWLDIVLLCKTVKVVLAGKGAY